MGDFSLNASYDVPPPAQRMTPSSSASSLAPESLSNRSSGVEQQCQYDIPPPPVKAMHDLSLSHDVGTPLVNPATLLYDVPPTVSKDVGSLPLEQSAALETLSRLEAELLAATSRLLGFVGPEWRTGLEGKTLDLKLAAHRVRTALHDLLRFLESALANAVNAADRCLAPKLRILLRMLRNAESVLAESMVTLDRNEWISGMLIRTDAMSQEIPDALDQLIHVAKDIPDNTRQACGFIQGNAPLLFKREVDAGLKQGEETDEVSGLEDYDYVNLESKASVARSHAETKAHLAPQLRERYETLINSDLEVLSLDPSDQRVLAFFTSQAASHAASLTAAIDAFLLTIEQNQPPASFLAHGKFVVLSAHKLVTIGDAVHRHVEATTVRKRVLDSTNALSDALASAVHKTKRAAMQFPSVTAVQEMVDSVVDISHLSRDLKLQISHAASN
jgi:enhancer-of-filamentation protein 1